jgi:hypothetical protein
MRRIDEGEEEKMMFDRIEYKRGVPAGRLFFKFQMTNSPPKADPPWAGKFKYNIKTDEYQNRFVF